MDKEYLDILKNTDLRPGKVKIIEHDKELLMENEERGMMDLHDEIIKWFMKNPRPEDSKVHKFAEKMGIEPDKFEGHIYMILSDLIHEGRSKNFNGKYDPKELAMGIEVEKEHLPYPSIAEKIARDHLAELPDYYTRLNKMEKTGEKEEKVNELFIQQGEIESMENGLQKDMSMLRLSMIAELDASNLYERFAELTDNEDISKVMLDVSKEEKVHAGEFETLLEEIDGEYEEAEEEGEKEVEDMSGE